MPPADRPAESPAAPPTEPSVTETTPPGASDTGASPRPADAGGLVRPPDPAAGPRWRAVGLLDAGRGGVGRCLDFYWDRFLTSYCARPLLPLVPLVLLGLAGDVIGKEYGVGHLFWHDGLWHGVPLKQGVVGFALALVVAQCLLIGYLLDRTVRRPGYARPTPPFWLYAPGIAVCFALTIGLAVGLAAGFEAVNRWDGKPQWARGYLLPREAGRAEHPTVGGYDEGAARRVLGAGRPDPGPPGGDSAGAGPAAWEGRRAIWWRGVVPPLAVGAAVGLVVVGVGAVVLNRLLTRWLGPAPAAVAARVPPPTEAESRWYYALVLVLVVAGVVLFELAGLVVAEVDHRAEGVTWKGAAAGAATFAVFGAGLLGATRRLFPVGFDRLVHVARGDELPPTGPYRLHHLAVLFAVLSGAVFGGLSTCGPAASPLVAGCFLLTVVLTGYGVVAYLLRRAVPVALAGLVLLGLIGGIPPYKLRFADLGRYYTEDRLAYLQPEADRDAREIVRRDVAAREYVLAADDRFRAAAGELRRKYPAGGPDYVRERRAAFEPLNPRLFGDGSKEVARNRLLPALEFFPEERVEEADRLLRESYPLTIHDVAFGGPGGRRDQPLVVVSVSGGGLRAAAWTFQVLSQLEVEFARAGVDFPGGVRIIAGASGGMLGAAYFVATLPPREERAANVSGPGRGQYADDRKKAREGEFRRLTRDFLTPLVNRMVYHDVHALFTPFRAGVDRGERLQRAWEEELGEDRAGRNYLRQSFADLWHREKAGDIPSLVFSPMLVEDGRRLLVSNLDLRYVASNDSGLITAGSSVDPDAPSVWTDYNLSREAVELFRLFPDARDRFRLSTAVRMSASFPFFSPAVTLPTHPRRRVVDAGYYDNYGVSLVASYLFTTRHQSWIQANASKILLVQIRDSLSEDHRRLQKVRPEESTSFSRMVEELVTPLEGLDSGRVGSASYRNDGQVELLSKYLSELWRERVARDSQATVPAADRDGVARRAWLAAGLGAAGEPLSAAAAAATDRDGVARRAGSAAGLGAAWDPLPAAAAAAPAARVKTHPDWATSPFTTVLFELGKEASLSWYLTAREQQDILDADFRSRDDAPWLAPDPSYKTGEERRKHGPGRKVKRMLAWWYAAPAAE